MRELLRKLGIAEGSDLPLVLSRAWRIHLSREGQRGADEAVPRATLLYAAATTNLRILDVLQRAGMDREMWTTSLSLGEIAEPGGDNHVPNFSVPSSMKALEWYAREMASRPLDAVGLAAAIVITIDGLSEKELKRVGVDVAKAAAAFGRMLHARGPVEVAIDSEFVLRPFARTLLRQTAQFISDQQIGLPGVSTSTFLITLLTTNSVPPDASPRFLQEFVDRLIGRSRMEETIAGWVNWYESTKQQATHWTFTEPMFGVLEQARAIARQVSGPRSEIQLRHLVGALLTVPETGALDLLHELTVDPTKLKRDYFTWLEEQGIRSGEGDDSEEWRRVLGVANDQRWLPHFDAEGFGDDKLNIRRDVKAFAALLAAKKLVPPLSIGLFGDWGSGKSFFMSMLKRQIAHNAGRDKEIFYERIVQIDFNAWHYVEANLWASLVEHIFRNLSVAGEKPIDVENRRNALLHQLNETVAAEAAAKENVRRAEMDRDRVATNLAATKASVAEDAATLRDLRARDIWEIATIDDADRDELRHALNAAGLAQAISSTNELRHTFNELQSIGHRTRLLWLTITRKPSTWIGLVIVALLAPIAGAVLADFLRRYNIAVMQHSIAQLVVQAGTVISAFALWFAPLLRGARKVLDRIDAAKAKVENRLHEAERRRQEQVDAQQHKLDDATSALTQAQADLIQKETAVMKARKALLDISAGQQLARFIDDRAASDDYRKLLGVLATVRGDFEKLSALMRGQDGERMEGDLFRIDRIILYIDDLDRCPPDRVVDVLQAVHLLLAFPLFVVVVGVDARWVEESLRQKHSAFRKGESSSDVPGYAVAPHDYLEKIFQVPFWLEPITAGGSSRFIDRLLAAEIEELPSEQTNDRSEVREQPKNDGSHAQSVTVSNQVEETASLAIAEDEATPPLKLQRKELDVMKLLSGLVGRSPRTVKRFVNTYRIIRAGVPARRIEALLEENPVGDYKMILLLLAIVVGTPTISVELFKALRDAPPETAIDAFTGKLEESGEWKKAANAITAIAKSVKGEMTVGHLREHLDNVGRYSFRRAA
ncbi:MAG: hypothetical protein QOI24_2790 [Acidobacteriota bacterium]|jgi:hypothetical protein|nr:hypothetical protein [Acidobacteriota bacterium]